ncbi:MAG: hypothetical protein ACOYK6_04145 [Chthoniobacterales bacterium]
MKIVIARRTLVYIGTLALTLFFSGCANDLMMHSQSSSGLASYGIRRETYERITLGQELSYNDIMELEACHVPQETINYLYTEQNNYYFRHRNHAPHHHWPRAGFQENVSQVSTRNDVSSHQTFSMDKEFDRVNGSGVSASKHHSLFATREFEKATNNAEASFKKFATQERARDFESHATKMSERCGKINIAATVSTFSHEGHETVRALDSEIAHAIDDRNNKAKQESSLGSFEKNRAEKNISQKTSGDAHDVEKKIHSKLKSIF